MIGKRGAISCPAGFFARFSVCAHMKWVQTARLYPSPARPHSQNTRARVRSSCRRRAGDGRVLRDFFAGGLSPITEGSIRIGLSLSREMPWSDESLPWLGMMIRADGCAVMQICAHYNHVQKLRQTDVPKRYGGTLSMSTGPEASSGRRAERRVLDGRWRACDP